MPRWRSAGQISTSARLSSGLKVRPPQAARCQTSPERRPVLLVVVGEHPVSVSRSRSSVTVGWRRCLESGLEIESAAAFLFTQMQAIAERDQLGLESAIIFPVVPTQPSQILPLQTSARSRLALIDGAERNLFFGPARTPEYSLVRRPRPSNKDKPAVLMRRISHEGQASLHRNLLFSGGSADKRGNTCANRTISVPSFNNLTGGSPSSFKTPQCETN